MVITLEPRVEAALISHASCAGVSPEQLANKLLAERLLPAKGIEARDEWERGLLESARPWGVSFSDAALSSEGLYE